MKQKIRIWFSAIWNIRSFGKTIYTCEAKIMEVEEDQSNQLKNTVEFANKSRPKNERRWT